MKMALFHGTEALRWIKSLEPVLGHSDELLKSLQLKLQYSVPVYWGMASQLLGVPRTTGAELKPLVNLYCLWRK